MEDKKQIIDISSSTILRMLIFILLFFFLYFIRDILVMFLVALIISSSLSQPVSWLQKKKVPRVAGAILFYILFFAIFSAVIYMVIPPVASQIKLLAGNLPEYIDKLGGNFNHLGSEEFMGFTFGDLAKSLAEKLNEIGSNIFSAIINLFGGIFSAFLILVISFYLTVLEDGVKKFLMSIIPGNHQEYVFDLINRVQKKMGSWLRGQFILAFAVGLLTYLGLLFLGVEYALTLALVAGVLELIPYVGPVISAVPAIAIGLAQSVELGFLVLLLCIVVQQLENHILVPQIMRRVVGLNPLVIIMVIMIGAKLAGFSGILIAVPVAAGLAEFLKDLRRN